MLAYSEIDIPTHVAFKYNTAFQDRLEDLSLKFTCL